MNTHPKLCVWQPSPLKSNCSSERLASSDQPSPESTDNNIEIDGNSAENLNVTPDTSMFLTEPVSNASAEKQCPSKINRRLTFLTSNEESEEEIETNSQNSDDESDISFLPAESSGDLNQITETLISDDSLSGAENIIEDCEIVDLLNECFGGNSFRSVWNEMDARWIATQDYWSSLFIDPSDALWEDGDHGNGLGNVNSSLHSSNASQEDERSDMQRHGGLGGWNYSSAFDEVEIRLDDADSKLGERYVNETNTVLNNVLKEIRMNSGEHEVVSASLVSPMKLFDVFLPESIMQKLKLNINRVLNKRNQSAVTTMELKEVLVNHVLAASCHSTVSTITAPENAEFYYQTCIFGDRYNVLWSAMSCTLQRRQRVEQAGSGWSNRPVRGNALITELEQELSAVNRSFAYVPGSTIFSLDDDHQRLRSRAVTELTNLSHMNNPHKALGPLNNAICSALTSTFLAGHYTRPGEKLIHIWERLVQFIQGDATPGCILPMTDAVFAADRGYNAKETIEFVNERLGATELGTHKRSLDYPLVFGDGPMTKRHKGMCVSKKGCRAVYSATKMPSGNNGRVIEGFLYRESFSGRIAAMYHNDMRSFGSHSYTLVPKSGFRRFYSQIDLRRVQEVFSLAPTLTRSTATGHFLPRAKLEFTLQGLMQLTLLQSEDPGRFLARAFQFTSRTTHGFFTSVASDYEKNLHALASMLSGKLIMRGANRVPEELAAAELTLRGKWDAVLDILKCRSANPKMKTRSKKPSHILPTLRPIL